ncbi:MULTISPECIES: hypothetical protein [unclassified Rhizobium]|uniref:hypothetical protein n=1 Tax=unclassified Rhizobium TaxID=2613769 RepID=UPI001FD566E9|nr:MULTISPECIES: hypothetical protein [unclassified Rhizobium]
MRGVYTAALLDKLSSYYAKLRDAEALDIGKGFDLMAGTSTGAMLRRFAEYAERRPIPLVL